MYIWAFPYAAFSVIHFTLGGKKTCVIIHTYTRYKFCSLFYLHWISEFYPNPPNSSHFYRKIPNSLFCKDQDEFPTVVFFHPKRSMIPWIHSSMQNIVQEHSRMITTLTLKTLNLMSRQEFLIIMKYYESSIENFQSTNILKSFFFASFQFHLLIYFF